MEKLSKIAFLLTSLVLFLCGQAKAQQTNNNALTRRGSDTITGSVYGFGRNATITGTDNAGKQGKMPGDYSNYTTGVTLGFPILKNKLFFFTNDELTRETLPVQQIAGGAISNN